MGESSQQIEGMRLVVLGTMEDSKAGEGSRGGLQVLKKAVEKSYCDR